MNRSLSRILLTSGVGSACGAVAAIVGYRFREPEGFTLDTTIKVDDLTISDQLWCIVGLALLGALVCGGIAAVCSVKKGPAKTLLAFAVAAPIGAIACWGARWVMDQATYHLLGPPEARVDILSGAANTFLPWIIWQIGCGFSLSLPISVAIGLNKYTFLRGLLGAGLVMVLGFVLSQVIGIVMVLFAIGNVAAGGNATSVAEMGDTMYLFVLGAAAGIAFGIAEAIYKPAWLKSVRGASEGRTWTLQAAYARIGSAEGVEVHLPPDGTVAPIHAQIQAEEDAHHIVDLAGGLTVNNVPQQATWLRDGDRIGVGSALLLYRTRLDTKPKEAPRIPTAIPTPASAPNPVLVDSLGHRHTLHPGVNVVGREVGCDVVLSWESSVSRRHAEFIVNAEGVTVNDLGSTNGTYVDEQRIHAQVHLQGTKKVTLGRCAVTIERP